MKGPNHKTSLVMQGYAATRGSLKLLEDPEVYEGRFRGSYLDEARETLKEDISANDALSGTFLNAGYKPRGKAESPEGKACGNEDAWPDHLPIVFKADGKEGVLNLLYRISQELGTGLEADLFAIPVRQSTIELCECADINPYLLDSEGVFIAVTDDEDGFTERFGGVTIGKLRNDNQKFVRIGERVSFLSPGD